MTSSVSYKLKCQLIKCVEVQWGLHFPEDRWQDLERGIRSAAQEFGFTDVQSCVQWLVSANLDKKDIEVIASHLTVGETYFFREKKSLEILERHILPELIHSRHGSERHLRIWCTACATGEEPYSIAIMLSRMIPNLKEWNITILATDISSRSLLKAEEGVYTEWSFRDTTPEIKEKYFTRTKDGCYEILPRFKKMVTFSCLNLAEDVYPSLLNNTNALDMVFCRNVLMYFGPDRVKNVIEQLCCSLVDGGFLIVSTTDASIIQHPQLVATHCAGVPIYKKDIAKSLKAEDITTKWFHKHSTHNETKPIFRPPVDTLNFPYPPLEKDKKDSGIHLTQSAQTYEVINDRVGSEELRQPSTSADTSIKSDLYTETLALYDKCRYAEVISKLLNQISRSQNDSKILILLARSYANQGKLTDALKWCDKAIAVDKLNPGCYYLYATIQEEQGQIIEAIKSFRHVLYLDPEFILAHFALGNLSKKEGKLKESENHFKNAIRLLSHHRNEDILPKSDGIVVGRFIDIMQTIMTKD